MTYTFYPGCALEQTSVQYGTSSRAVCEALGVELKELGDWNCCGATAYTGTQEAKAFSLSARNLALVEQEGAKELVTACNGCYVVLNKACKYMAENPGLKADIDDALSAGGMTYRGTVKVRHLLDVLVNDVGLDRIKRAVKVSLSGLKVAPYYGCQIGRPYQDFDDAEYPMTLDQCLSALQAEVVPYPLKAKCCGGMLATTQPEVALRLIRNLLDCARQRGAAVIATTCPLCNVNLDAYQDHVAKQFGTQYDMPILHFTQLMGVAFKLPEEHVGLSKCLVSPEAALKGYV